MEMAIMEIMQCMDKKLLDSLLSEVFFLRKINYLNIISLQNFIQIENARQSEAFAVQLVVLAIWKQALHICHALAASAIERNPSTEVRTRESDKDSSNTAESISCIGSELPVAVCSLIKNEFLLEVGHSEELAVDLGQIAEAREMPDAIEIIFQSALAMGRCGAVSRTFQLFF